MIVALSNPEQRMCWSDCKQAVQKSPLVQGCVASSAQFLQELDEEPTHRRRGRSSRFDPEQKWWT
jgi:hypothetical protein